MVRSRSPSIIIVWIHIVQILGDLYQGTDSTGLSSTQSCQQMIWANINYYQHQISSHTIWTLSIKISPDNFNKSIKVDQPSPCIGLFIKGLRERVYELCWSPCLSSKLWAWHCSYGWSIVIVINESSRDTRLDVTSARHITGSQNNTKLLSTLVHTKWFSHQGFACCNETILLA